MGAEKGILEEVYVREHVFLTWKFCIHGLKCHTVARDFHEVSVCVAFLANKIQIPATARYTWHIIELNVEASHLDTVFKSACVVGLAIGPPVCKIW